MTTWSQALEVLTLFLIPIGGGIPAGAVIANNYGMSWIWMATLYFVSDLILACAFEPLMLLFIMGAKKSLFLSRWLESYRIVLARTGVSHPISPGPFALVVISFGVDPMTGRALAKAAGHGFVAGWAIAILGDMFFFALIASSTLLLNHVLGDGQLAAVIILILMLVVPHLYRRLRTRMSSGSRSKKAQTRKTV